MRVALPMLFAVGRRAWKASAPPPSPVWPRTSRSMRSSISSGSLKPSREKNLMPVSWYGLWLALMTTPASARIDSVMKAMPGVGRGPHSITSTPIEQMPEAMACSSRYPESRVSLPITIRWRCGPLRTRKARARPSWSATSAVMGCTFATPRTPSVPKSRRAALGERASRAGAGSREMAFSVIACSGGSGMDTAPRGVKRGARQGPSRCSWTSPCEGWSDSPRTPAGSRSDSGRTDQEAAPAPVRDRSMTTGPRSLASSERKRAHGPDTDTRRLVGSGTAGSSPAGSFASTGTVSACDARRSPWTTKRIAAAMASESSRSPRSDRCTAILRWLGGARRAGAPSPEERGQAARLRAHEEPRQQLAQRSLVQRAVEGPIDRARDLAPLLRDHHHGRVDLLGQPHRRAAARPQLAQLRRGAERQQAAGRRQPPALQHDRPVVDRAARVEEREEQLGRGSGVELHARLDDLPQLRLALQDDERAPAPAGEVGRRAGDAVDEPDLRPLLVGDERDEEAAATEVGEPAPDVSLEQDDDPEDEGVAEEMAEEPVERDEVRPLRAEVPDPEQEESDEHVDGARAADEPQHPIDQVTHHRQIDDGEPHVPPGGSRAQQVLDDARNGYDPHLHLVRSRARSPPPARSLSLALSGRSGSVPDRGRDQGGLAGGAHIVHAHELDPRQHAGGHGRQGPR